MEKRIELVKMRAGDIKTGFGNPRKISKKKLEELEESLKTFGDFGIFLIDEHDNVVGGNQRLKAIISLYGEDVMIDCKKFYGYTKAELRAINIKDNTHAGEWDLEALANWTADLNVDVGIKDEIRADVKEHEIEAMELIPFEKYNYVLIVCKANIDYDNLTTKLGLKDKQVLLAKGKNRDVMIRARAVWYNEVEHLLFGGNENA